jgi:hypothetical protein
MAVALYQKGDKIQAKRYAELALKAQPPNAEANAIRELLTKIG